MVNKAMSPADFTVRCYVEREPDGSWFAMCIDLNLCAQADSMAAAKQRLEVIVYEYVMDAFTKYRGSPELLTRRPPLSFVVRYYVILVERWFERRARRQLAHRHEQYRETLPMIPAAC